MSASPRGSAVSGEVDRLVAEVVAEITDRLHAGETADVEEYIARHPELADRLRPLLAALDLLARFSSSAGSDGPPAPAVAGEEMRGTLGDFRLIRELGRGGMGVVYEAEQTSLGRRVALKVLPFAVTLDPRQLQRFGNEARAAAGLHHTNIVPVYAVGCERGVHYYAMQFIEGRTLAELIGQQRGGAPSPVPAAVPESGAGAAPTVRPPTSTAPRDAAYFRRAAEWGIQAAEALDHAHALGVVHRDVKPANLLVDAGGRLWVTDFGLAQVQSDVRLTRTGDLVGTLRYMSPEQALAKRVVLDHRTDVYSLGATLYELLTQEPAFPGTDRQELLRQIAFEEPKPPRRLHGAIPAELETIVLKAMEKSPADRYATAGELADDLGRYLRNESIHARRPSLLQRARKWGRRHQGVTLAVAAALLVVALVSTASAVMIWGQMQEVRGQKQLIGEQKQQTDEALRDRTDALRERTRALYVTNVRLAEFETRAGNMSRAEKFLDDCAPELRQWEWHYLKRLCHPEELTLRGHTGPITAVTFSPDGRLLASAAGVTVKVWDASTGREVHSLQMTGGNTRELVFSSNQARIARGCLNNSSLWDLETSRELLRTAAGTAMDLSPDGKLLANAGRLPANEKDWAVQVWDVGSGQERCTLRGGPGRVACLAFSPDGRRLAVAFHAPPLPNKPPPGRLTVMDVETGRALVTVAAHGAQVRCLVFSPGGELLATGSADWTVKLWDATTGQEARTLRGHTGPVSDMVFSPDGQRLISRGSESQNRTPTHSVREWEVGTGNAVSIIPVPDTGVIALDPNGRLLAIPRDREVVIRPAGRSEGALNIRGVTAAASAAFSPDGSRVAVSGVTVRVCDTATGDEVLNLKHGDMPRPRERDGLVWGVACSPDGTRLASASDIGTAKVWDARTGQELMTLDEHTKAVYCAAFSPDGRRLATASADRTAKVWDLATGRAELTLAHADSVVAVAFSPDGQRLVSATGGGDGETDEVKVWDLKTGQEVLKLTSPPSGLRGVEFSRDGTRIVAPAADPAGGVVAKVWDAATGQELLSAGDPAMSIGCARLSPDGHRLITPGPVGQLLIRDAATGEEILALHGHKFPVMALAFSPDGRRLASMSMLEKTVRVWDATPLE